MTTDARSQFLRLLRSGETQLRADLQQFADRARTYLMSAVDDATGKIPLQDQKKVEKQISDALLFYFLATGATAYVLTADGTLIPTSPYMRLLWAEVGEATRQAVNEQARRLRRSLEGNEDIQRRLANATVSPFATGGMDGALFDNYVPPYIVRWNDGKSLQDRVLFCAAATRQHLAFLLAQLFSEGKPAKEIANSIDRYFAGTLKRTGFTNGAFDASRLLLSETNYAYQKASLVSAALDPFMQMVDVVLSPSHRTVDDCDTVAGNGPYRIEDAPVLGIHPDCLCDYRFHTGGTKTAIVERLRGDPARTNIRGALSPGFADLLLRGNG